jgi:hypothetical protein
MDKSWSAELATGIRAEGTQGIRPAVASVSRNAP